MQHEPRAALTNAQLTVHLHAADALEVRHKQVDADRPELIGQLGALHDGALPQREEGLAGAVPATVCHRLVLDVFLNIRAAAVGAECPLGPTDAGEPFVGRLFGSELLRNLQKGDAIPVSLAGAFMCACHWSCFDVCCFCL